jgi:DNA-binding CsgD family transcriptional regulator
MDLHGDQSSLCHQARTQSVADDAVLALLRSLVIALLSESCNPGEFEAAKESEEVLLDTDADGYRYLLLRTRTPNQQRTPLSPREQEIARMVASGYPSKAIASILNISCWTVGTHLRRIYAKLGVNTRAAMVDRLHETRLGAHARTSASSSSETAEDARRRIA